MIEIICCILICLSAICSAVMDSVENEVSFKESIFLKYNHVYWSKVDGANNTKLPGTKYTWNAWHNFKSAMIILNATAFILIAFFTPHRFEIIDNIYLRIFIFAAIYYSVYALLWNKVFSFFYHTIFKSNDKAI